MHILDYNRNDPLVIIRRIANILQQLLTHSLYDIHSYARIHDLSCTDVNAVNTIRPDVPRPRQGTPSSQLITPSSPGTSSPYTEEVSPIWRCVRGQWSQELVPRVQSSESFTLCKFHRYFSQVVLQPLKHHPPHFPRVRSTLISFSHHHLHLFHTTGFEEDTGMNLLMTSSVMMSLF